MKKQIIFSLLLFLLFAGSLAAKAPQTDWEYYQKGGDKSARWDPLVKAGFEAFEGQNYSAALSFLKRAMALGCKDGLVIFKLGFYHESEGEYGPAIYLMKEAEPLLRKGYSSHPISIQFSDHLGGLYYQMGQYEEALSHYLAAIQNQGEDFLRTYLAGQIYRMKQKNEEAIVYFEKSLFYTPPAGSPPNMKLLAMVELLKLYEATRQDAKALPMAEQILSVDPANPVALSAQSKLEHRKLKQKEKEKWKEMIEKY